MLQQKNFYHMLILIKYKVYKLTCQITKQNTEID